MTKTEFGGQFDRLCSGFKTEPTKEQADAWFRRIGHYALSVWAEAVTTLLCSRYFPKLDEALTSLEHEADSQRRVAVERDKYQANRTIKRLEQPIDPEAQSRIPTPGTPLFACIKATAGLIQAQRNLQRVEQREYESEAQQKLDRQRLRVLIGQCEQDLKQYSHLLHEEDALRLTRMMQEQAVEQPVC